MTRNRLAETWIKPAVAILAWSVFVAVVLVLASTPAHSAEKSPVRTERLYGWEVAASRSARTTETSEPATHVVRRGDTLEEIATKHEVPGGFERLHYVNRKKVSNADLIEVGMKLVIPKTNGKKIQYVPPAPPEPAWTPTEDSHSTTSSSSPSSSGSAGSWAATAACESSGNWSANTGNGYYGGLQFSLSSWRAVGGSGYPHEASMSEQVMRAEMLADASTGDPWPNCPNP